MPFNPRPPEKKRDKRQIGVFTTPELYEKVRKVAHKNNISMSAVARQALEYALENMEK